MKALIHGNCDRERRKWKICRMLMLAAMKGLEEKMEEKMNMILGLLLQNGADFKSPCSPAR